MQEHPHTSFCVDVCAQCSVGDKPGSRITGLDADPAVRFWRHLRPRQPTLTAAAHFRSPAVWAGSALHTLVRTCSCLSAGLSPPRGCKVASHRGSDVHFLWLMVLSISLCVYWPFAFLFGEGHFLAHCQRLLPRVSVFTVPRSRASAPRRAPGQLG